MNFYTALIALLVVPAQELEIQRTHKFGDVITSSENAIYGQIQFAEWLSDSRIVYSSRSGSVYCCDLETEQFSWTIEDLGPISSISVSPATNRVAILLDSTQFGRNDVVLKVLDGDTGDELFATSCSELARIVDRSYVVPSKIAMSPVNGQLLFVHFSTTYGENAYLLNESYDRVISRVLVDGGVRSVAIGEDGKTLTTFSSNEVVCVNSLSMNEEVFLHGERIHDESDTRPITSDVPIMSSALFNGDSLIVYAIDRPFETGNLLLEDFTTGEFETISTANAHIVMDIEAKREWIAVSGTSAELAIVTFGGEDIGTVEKASSLRVNGVKFSPSGEQVLVAGADGTVIVYRIIE